MSAKPYATPQFHPIANANTGYCIGFKMAMPSREWVGSTLVRQTMAEFAPLEGRQLFVQIETLSAQNTDTLLNFRDRAVNESGFQLIASITAIESKHLVEALKREGIPLAIDHFGVIANGIQVLLDADPDYGFIDASIVRGIAKDARRRVLLFNLIRSAHTLGVEVIASGVDNLEDFTICRDMTGEMVCGDYIQPAISSAEHVVQTFPHLSQNNSANPFPHCRSIDQRWILQQLDIIPPLSVDTPLKSLYERMAQTADAATIPVIERDGRPIGLLLEKTFKNLAYSAYGRDLLSNRGWGKTARDFITRCPIADATTPLDQLLAIYSTSEDVPGVIITNNGAYGGFLSTPSIIRALHERTLARAQDENPLTRLPGNALIGDYLTGCLNSDDAITITYLDFDNFKPFNDIYGFRQGDRAILLFAQILRDYENRHAWFVGHIGGDDFFAAIPHIPADHARQQVSKLIQQFTDDARSFYDAEARAQGYITGPDRDGNLRQFPLLSASAVVLPLPQGIKSFTVDDISTAIAQFKKQSKAAPDRIAVATLAIQKPYCEVSAPELLLPKSA